MNDEIKEILEDLQMFIQEKYLLEDVLNEKKTKILLDYITNLQYKYENQIHRYMNLKDYATNLQKENEELKSKNDILEFRMKQNDKMVICERYRILKQRDDYKKRIDNAIEYIKNNQPVFSMWNKKQISKWFDEEFYKELLDILNGGDK